MVESRTPNIHGESEVLTQEEFEALEIPEEELADLLRSHKYRQQESIVLAMIDRRVGKGWGRVVKQILSEYIADPIEKSITDKCDDTKLRLELSDNIRSIGNRLDKLKSLLLVQIVILVYIACMLALNT